MKSIITFLVTVFWLLDIFNISGMEMFDTTYELNTWFWIVFWIVAKSPSVASELYEQRKERKKK